VSCVVRGSCSVEIGEAGDGGVEPVGGEVRPAVGEAWVGARVDGGEKRKGGSLRRMRRLRCWRGLRGGSGGGA
jgi:hypothetical protein